MPKWLDTLVYDLQRNRGRRTNDASLSTVINFTKLLLITECTSMLVIRRGGMKH